MNQKRRTEQALVDAAKALIDRGKTPSLAEVADEALVSRATVYRYFPGPGELLARVMVVDQGIAELDASVEEGLQLPDAPSRLDALVRGYLRFADRYQAGWRKVIAIAVQQGRGTPAGDREPGLNARRGEVRGDLVRRALEPLRDELDEKSARLLEGALELCVGTEAFLALRDVQGLDADEADEVASWAAQALLETALRESSAGVSASRRRRGR